MRIVLDTNVVLSALLWRGTPFRLLHIIRQHEHVRLFTSAALLVELAEVLIRPGPANRLAIIGRAAHDVLTDYIDAVELVTPASLAPTIVADRDDDQVLAAAVGAEADLIVSGDHHLLGFRSYQTIRIVKAADAMALISG